MFKTIEKKFFPILVDLVQEAIESRNTVLETGLLYEDDRIDSNVIASAFHKKLLLRRYELAEAGIELIDSNASNEKYYITIPEYNCRIRFGKMNQRYHMAKCSRKTDIDFANQQIEFNGFNDETRLHLGYVLGNDGFSLVDIALACPRTINENSDIVKLSDGYQGVLFSSSNDQSEPADGTALKKLQQYEKRKDKIIE